MKKRKRYRLKKQAYFLLIGIVLIIALVIVGQHYYQNYLYQQTDEYHLLQKGYSLDDTKLLLDKLTSDQISNLLDSDYDEIYVSLANQKYFLNKNLDDYIAYHNKEDEDDLDTVVAVVNVHANHKWYNYDINADTSLNEKIIVNKFYKLDSNYAPENLKNISLDYAYGDEGDNKLVDYAYDAFIELWDAAHDAGYYLMVNYSYRDYKEQEDIYDSYKTSYGERKADSVAARPGYSEHQTGLVVDMVSKDTPTSDAFSTSDAYHWLQANAYQYGWIERYPENKTYLTGYNAESWHWRYVGKDIAKVMHEENITYDEYYAYYIDK